MAATKDHYITIDIFLTKNVTLLRKKRELVKKRNFYPTPRITTKHVVQNHKTEEKTIDIIISCLGYYYFLVTQLLYLVKYMLIELCDQI